MKQTKKGLLAVMNTISTDIQEPQDLEKARKSKADFDEILEETHKKVEATYQAEQKHVE